MAVAALVTWLLTAAGGLVMLGIWLTRGGARAQSVPAGNPTAQAATGTATGPSLERTHLPPALVFTHVLLAVAGLVLWIIYVATDTEAIAWTAFVLLIPVAGLGLTMFARWVSAGEHRRGAHSGAERPESGFPLPTVAAHGLLAVTTVVLVLLAALGVGGS